MSYADRIAALERRVSRLEGAPDQPATPAVRPSPPPAPTPEPPPDLVALEMPPLRQGQTRASLQVWLRGGLATIAVPGPALIVDRADLDHRDLAHLVASGDVVPRVPTEPEIRDYLARRGRR